MSRGGGKTSRDAPAAERPRGAGSALFAYIEKLQGETPFGRVLDAGTGPRSIRWLMSLETDSLTAVTADPGMQRQVQALLDEGKRPQDRLVLGNWSDPDLLAGEQFDTVVADYLLGSVEGFAPYAQTQLFGRLRPLTAKRLYVAGVQPYVVERPADEAGLLLWRIGRYRDACLTLLGKQPYREFPLEWVIAELKRSGFEVADAGKFPMRYKADFVSREVDLARPGLRQMADKALGHALLARGDALRGRALAQIESHGSLSAGFSYVVAADPV